MTTWVVLPGFALAPSDFQPLADHLTHPAVVVDSWQTPVTDPVPLLRERLGLSGATRIGLIGHSIGGLAALEWALRHPEQVERLVLLDPTDPLGRVRPGMQRGGRGHHVVRASIRTVTGVFPHAGLQGRRALLRAQLRREDSLPRVEARSRFAREGLLLLADQWIDTAEQERRVRHLLETTDLAAIQSLDALHVVGSGAGLQRRFLHGQRRLSSLIGARTTYVSGTGHLFPIQHPRTVAELIDRDSSRRTSG